MVLALLNQGPEYGYSIIKSTGIKSGTLYPILMRLKDRGHISSSWQDSEELGRPPRQIYKITPKGRALLNEVAETPQPSQTHIQVKI